jgi:uncharacterized protein (DUF433 family)
MVTVGIAARLDREMFSEAEAARLLKMSQGTLHWWLEGAKRGSKTYPPVIREQSTGSREVTWGGFVEAALLRQYRKEHGVALRELRAVIDRLRATFGSPYPLADLRPYVGPGRHLLLEIQRDARLTTSLWLVAVADDQLLLTPPAMTFFERVEWDGDIAVGWRPHDDPASPVRMAPDVRFGLPAVGGIRTEIIWEHLDAEESFEEVATTYGLAIGDVRWAHAYETSLRAA